MDIDDCLGLQKRILVVMVMTLPAAVGAAGMIN
jgi:hypothetical protein